MVVQLKPRVEGWLFESLGLNTDLNNTSIYVYMYDWFCENSVNEKIILLYQVSYRLGFYNF